jgi:hypothetical protein
MLVRRFACSLLLAVTAVTGCSPSPSEGAGGGAATASTTTGPTGSAGSSSATTSASTSTGTNAMQNPVLTAIAPNGLLDLGPYTCDQPLDNPGGCKAITDYGKFVYDAAAHQLLMWGGGHAGNYGSSVVRFDFATLAWSAVYPSTTCANQLAGNFDADTASWKDTHSPTARHTWDMMSIAEVSGVRSMVILTSGGIGGYETCNPATQDPVPASGKPMWYDIDAHTWAFGKTPADSLWYYASSTETDPVSKKIVVLALANGFGAVELYDPDDGMVKDLLADFSKIDLSKLGYSNNLVYFPPNDRFYYLTRGTPVSVFEIAVDRKAMSATIADVTPAGSPDNPNETGWAFDSVNKVIGGVVVDSTFLAFDPTAKSWTTRTMDVTSKTGVMPSKVAFHALDFDPVDGVFLYLTQSDSHMWAYRYK